MDFSNRRQAGPGAPSKNSSCPCSLAFVVVLQFPILCAAPASVEGRPHLLVSVGVGSAGEVLLVDPQRSGVVSVTRRFPEPVSALCVGAVRARLHACTICCGLFGSLAVRVNVLGCTPLTPGGIIRLQAEAKGPTHFLAGSVSGQVYMCNATASAITGACARLARPACGSSVLTGCCACSCGCSRPGQRARQRARAGPGLVPARAATAERLPRRVKTAPSCDMLLLCAARSCSF